MGSSSNETVKIISFYIKVYIDSVNAGSVDVVVYKVVTHFFFYFGEGIVGPVDGDSGWMPWDVAVLVAAE